MSFSSILNKRVYSGDNIMNFSDVRYLPRWVILAIDVCIIVIAILFSRYLIRKLTLSTADLFLYNDLVFVMIATISVFFMIIFRTYAGIIRHSTFIDLFKLFLAVFSTTLLIAIINFSYFLGTGQKLIKITIPFLVLFFASSFMMLFLFRLFVKEFFNMMRDFQRNTARSRILVLGIDQRAIAMARAVIDNTKLPYHIVGFLTQRPDSRRASLLGKPIFTKERIQNNSKSQLALDGVLIFDEQMTKDDMNSWVTFFLEKDLKIYKAPSLEKLKSNDQKGTIKTLQIEDLLNRKPIKIQNEAVKKRHLEKTILITGGAGSIGSEIMRQVALFNPKLIVIVDQAETPLYEIEMEMRNSYPHLSFKFVLADISNKKRMEHLFEKFQFSMVYHAAAYKHVPLIEENPHEAILVNILGSMNLSTLASKYQVNRFVMISTDKAVKPTNVMGASKRASELFVQALQKTSNNSTKFITTRFGNVLGSNGSVIPHFRKQIENGGPITITHQDITRYFMTIPEACDLVLQAGAMGNGGEIFVFDMGDPVKILDLANRMIKLSGLEPNIDIKIIYTGLRPGEKLYEELLSDDATAMPTHHEKIMISKDPTTEFHIIEEYCNSIVQAASCGEKTDVVQILKNIVPEFKSNNSVYEMLDK